jgi:hypothetical protein
MHKHHHMQLLLHSAPAQRALPGSCQHHTTNASTFMEPPLGMCMLQPDMPTPSTKRQHQVGQERSATA